MKRTVVYFAPLLLACQRSPPSVPSAAGVTAQLILPGHVVAGTPIVVTVSIDNPGPQAVCVPLDGGSISYHAVTSDGSLSANGTFSGGGGRVESESCLGALGVQVRPRSRLIRLIQLGPVDAPLGPGTLSAEGQVRYHAGSCDCGRATSIVLPVRASKAISVDPLASGLPNGGPDSE